MHAEAVTRPTVTLETMSSLRQRGAGSVYVVQPPPNPSSEETIAPATLTTPVGVYGWRKTCLYGVVLALTMLSIINLGLILYIYRLLDVSASGSGVLSFSGDKMDVSGTATFAQGLVTDSIQSTAAGGLTILGTILSVVAGDASLLMSDGATKMTADQISMTDTLNRTLLNITADACTLNSTQVLISADAGVTISGTLDVTSIQGSTLNGADGSISIESLTNDVSIQAGADVHLSASDSINIDGRDISIQASGSMSLVGSDVQLGGLPYSSGDGSGVSHSTICACGPTTAQVGRLYLSSESDGSCTASTVCS